MKKLDEEEIYHLMDLLVMNTNSTKEQILLDDLQKKESISYDTDLIAKLESFLNELWFRTKEEIKELANKELGMYDLSEILDDVVLDFF